MVIVVETTNEQAFVKPCSVSAVQLQR